MLQPGDHIRARRLGYWHHAIYVGDGRVVHYTDVTKDKATATIRIGTLAEFAQGQRCEIVDDVWSDPAPIVLQRGYSRLGETNYDALTNNCEHFARWCKTGVSASEQVRRAQTTAGGAAAHGAATTIAVTGVVAAGTAAGVSGGASVMTGLATAGEAVGLGAAGGIGVVAAAPAVASAVMMNRVFRDEPELHAEERTARKCARAAGNFAAAAGTVSTVSLVSAAGIPGLSAAGITTGLAAIGSVAGGGMVAGLVVVAAVPALACAGASVLMYLASRRRARRLV